MSENKSSQVNLVFNIILSIAVIALFVMYSTKGGDDTPKVEEVSNTTSTEIEANTAEQKNEEAVSDDNFKVNMPENFTVAYVNTDSLWNQYKFVQDALVTLSNTEAQMKKNLENKAKKLKDDYDNYVRQGKAGLLTLQQQKDTEARLQQQQQEGVMLEQQLSDQLMQHRQAVNNQLTDTITSFLNTYRIEHNYTLILQYGYSSGLLSATPELDITKDVIKRLNAKYDFEKSH
jgi:outer membrane protein